MGSTFAHISLSTSSILLPGSSSLRSDLALQVEVPRQLRDLVLGCDAVISCLGHSTTLRGMFGSPRDLLAQTATRVSRALEATRPGAPAKYIFMSSVSVNQPAGREPRRGLFDRAVMGLLRGVMPPARDNQRAADFLCSGIGAASPFMEWVVMRPDTLREGEVTEYSLHGSLVNSLFAPANTNRANVAHFMCELAQDPRLWEAWRSRMPVIVNAASG
jgi:hypothetical protein